MFATLANSNVYCAIDVVSEAESMEFVADATNVFGTAFVPGVPVAVQISHVTFPVGNPTFFIGTFTAIIGAPLPVNDCETFVLIADWSDTSEFALALVE